MPADIPERLFQVGFYCFRRNFHFRSYLIPLVTLFFDKRIHFSLPGRQLLYRLAEDICQVILLHITIVNFFIEISDPAFDIIFLSQGMLDRIKGEVFSNGVEPCIKLTTSGRVVRFSQTFKKRSCTTSSAIH